MHASSSPYSDEVIRKLTWNLTVLASVKQNDKICTTSGCLHADPPTSYRSIVRRWYGEARTENMVAVEDVVHRSINLIQSGSAVPVSEHVRCQHERLLTALQSATQGMRNLLDTYSEDRTHAARLVLLINEVNDFLICTRNQVHIGSPFLLLREEDPPSL